MVTKEKKQDEYQKLLIEIHRLIPSDEYKEVMTQKECELQSDFLGFLEVYDGARRFIPKHFTIIDLGCYLAAQSYFFQDYKKYIGVDSCKLTRFCPKNSTHYQCSIQDFIKSLDELKLDLSTTFVICSYMPDKKAKEEIIKIFPNLLVYYPAH